MKLYSALKSAFGAKRVNLESRFEFSPKWVQGSSGRFHIVRQKSDGTTFGLKIIDSAKSKSFRERFATSFPTESEIALMFKHNSIVNSHQIGTSIQGNDFILMEYVNGVLLEELLIKKPQVIRKNVLTMIRQLANSIQYIHEQGFIHRDICPRNILISSHGATLKLFDFGLTVPNEAEYRQPRNRTGTPLYMAPEIVRRRETDQTVDVFAFGITVYQMLTGQHPWGVEENSSKSTLLFDSRPATDVREHLPNLDEKVADGIMKCLEFDRTKRCSSIKIFKMMIGLK